MNNKTLQSTNLQIHYLQVAAVYCFTQFTEEKISELLNELSKIARIHNVKGTLLLAIEGVNGTICGNQVGVQLVLETLRRVASSSSLEIKISWSRNQVFRRLKIRKKSEIVTMGITDVSPLKTVGKYVDPHKWNALIEDKETLLIDTRNNYEIAIGSFKGSLNPDTDTFREFPEWVSKKLIPLIEKEKPRQIAMFCTGGIRCEKATSYLQQKGVQDVHHLKGGILRYLEVVAEEKSLWEGECFVFDRRVALNHQLRQGIHKACYACGLPLKPEDLKRNSYIHGVQCHHCIEKFSDKDKARFAERQRQLDQQNEYSKGNHAK